MRLGADFSERGVDPRLQPDRVTEVPATRFDHQLDALGSGYINADGVRGLASPDVLDSGGLHPIDDHHEIGVRSEPADVIVDGNGAVEGGEPAVQVV